MSSRAGTRSMLLGLAALRASASGCGARSELVTGGHEACADGSRAGAVGCRSVAFADPVSRMGVGSGRNRFSSDVYIRIANQLLFARGNTSEMPVSGSK